MKLVIKHKLNKPVELPINYNYILQSIIYKCICNDNEGEVSILARPSELDLRHEMMNILVLNIPDIAVRMNQWKKENPNDIDKLSLVDITTVDERNNIATDCINTFTNLGIFYSNYVDQEKAKHLTFSTIKTITNEEKITTIQKKYNYLKTTL